VSRRVALLALVVALLACAPAASATVPGGYYGINAQYVFITPQSDWNTQLNVIAASGLDTVRTDVRWSAAEPAEPHGPGASGHHYDWSLFDSMVGALAQHHLRWLPTLGYPPPWAQVDPTDIGSVMAPGRERDFLTFARTLARRYGRGGSFWSSHASTPYVPVTEYELWNEPNVIYYWNPQTTAPEDYADLFMNSSTAIKAVDPAAKILVGGLALVNPPLAADDIDFVHRMYAHRPELRSEIEIFGLHPYQETVYWTFRRFAGFRQALDLTVGRRMPIAVTELGYTTTKVSDAERGSELSELTEKIPRSGCDIYDFMPYSWLSPEQNPSDPEEWFGIWNADGTPKPSGQEFVNSVLKMRSLSAPTDNLNLCDSQYPVPPDPVPPSAPPATPPAPAPKQQVAAIRKRSGPTLRLSVRRDRKHHQLVVTGDCGSSCRLDVSLMVRTAGKKGKPKFRTRAFKHSRRFSSRPQTLRFPLSKRLGRRFEVVVTAVDRSGASTRRSRLIRA
jgi:polysaccharide biosynthesis protein PslG